MKRYAKILICILLLGAMLCVGCEEGNDISFAVNDTLPDGEGRVATVILIGGQSNASGCGRDDYLQINVSEEKYAEYKNGYDNVYINYLAGPKLSCGFVKCATLQGEMDGCFGPELGLADKLHELYPERMFFIIKCAWGGSNLHEQWISPSSFGRTGEFYIQFTEFVRSSIEYLELKNYDVNIEAMCWMQGESDSFSVAKAKKYETYLNNFINDIRKEFEMYASRDGIAFVDAYIAENPIYWIYYEYINASKRAVAEKSPMNVLVDTVAHGLICSEEPWENPDLAHYDSMSQIKLGHLFAEEVAFFLD